MTLFYIFYSWYFIYVIFFDFRQFIFYMSNINIRMSTHSINDTPQETIPKPDIRKEMVLYFYTSILQTIIQKKEITINEPVRPTPSPEDVLIRNFSVLSKKPSLGKRRKEKISKQNITNMSKQKLNLKRMSSSTQLKKQLSISTVIKEKSISIPTDNWILEHTEENGKIKFINGNKYKGTIFCNMLHGHGKFTWSNGTVYEGEFINNEITGKGRFQYPDQSVYSGEVYKNYCHGFGFLYPAMFPSIYKGTFKLNLKHGCGWQLFSNNNTYEGEWVDDQMSGQGYRKYPSGAEYYGKFMMGKRNGYGVAVLKNHDIYAGDWIEGEKNGFGDYIWNIGNESCFSVPVHSCYYGSWIDNKRDGIGVINFGMEGGSRYAGYFTNNEKHGSGVIICENGHVIESNPIFLNDKPVHITDSGNTENLQPVNNSVGVYLNKDKIIPNKDEARSNVTYLEDSNKTRQEMLLKKFPLDGKLPYATPSRESSTISMCKTFKQNAYNSDVYDKVFPKIMDQYSSLSIPIGVSSELIDLNTHIYKIIEYKSRFKYSKKNRDDNASIFISQSTFLSCDTYSDYELHKFEENLTRKSIAKYLKKLKRIYNLYAKIGCIEKQPSFKPWLMRIFFWQLYRDCKIPDKGISLIEIDLMFLENFTFDSCIVHNPFEVIYFCQFLESLLHVSLALYGEKFISSDNGVLKQSFEYLMDNDILPNAGHFKGSALFEYKDVIPLKAVYTWYKRFGEPHTVKQFFRNIYKLENIKQSKNSEDIFDVPYIQIGRNVINCGNKIFYFEDECCSFTNTSPYEEKIKSVQHENINKLYFLAVLETEHIANNIFSICPTIKDNKDIINFDYELSFLEFHEILLLCTQEKIKMENKISKMTLIEDTSSIDETKSPKKQIKRNLNIRKSKKGQG